MNKLRIKQIRELKQSPNKKHRILSINREILKSLPEEVVKNYITKKLKKDLSLGDLIDIGREWYEVHDLSYQYVIPIFRALYKLITRDILLPNYTEGWSEKEIFDELDNIIERIRNKNKIILNKKEIEPKIPESIKSFNNNLIKNPEKVTLADIWGQEEAKKEIEDIINFIKYEDIMKSWSAENTNGIIFEGPSWTWKTLFAKAIANEIDAEVYNIKLSDIASGPYINEWVSNVHNLFEFIKIKNKNSNKKVVIIFDEVDALFKKRDSWRNNSWEDIKIVNTFLTEMDDISSLGNVIFIGTTNLIESIDPAIIRSGRMTTKIRLNLPNNEERKQIFEIHINKAKSKSKKAKNAFNYYDLEGLAKISDWFSGADIKEVIRIVIQQKALKEALKNKDNQKITFKDLEYAVKKIKTRKNYN